MEAERRRTSLEVCFGDRDTTLLDEFERLAFEIQLNQAILRRSFSEPSPVRFTVRPKLPKQSSLTEPSRPRETKPSKLPRAFGRLLRVFGSVCGRRRERPNQLGRLIGFGMHWANLHRHNDNLSLNLSSLHHPLGWLCLVWLNMEEKMTDIIPNFFSLSLTLDRLANQGTICDKYAYLTHLYSMAQSVQLAESPNSNTTRRPSLQIPTFSNFIFCLTLLPNERRKWLQEKKCKVILFFKLLEFVFFWNTFDELYYSLILQL